MTALPRRALTRPPLTARDKLAVALTALCAVAMLGCLRVTSGSWAMVLITLAVAVVGATGLTLGVLALGGNLRSPRAVPRRSKEIS